MNATVSIRDVSREHRVLIHLYSEWIAKWTMGAW